MEATALKLRYRSIDQFAEHCRQLKSGRMFIPTEMPLPAKTRLLLALILPDVSHRIELEMEVLEAVDRKSGEALQNHPPLVLGISGRCAIGNRGGVLLLREPCDAAIRLGVAAPIGDSG